MRRETRTRWWLRAFAVAALLAVFAVVGAITFLAEVVSAASTDLRFVFAASLAGLLPLLLAAWFTRSRAIVALGGAWVVFVVATHFVALNPVKPFRQFFADLQPGMTEQQIRLVLNQHFPVSGRFRVPRESKMPEYQQVSFTLDPTNGNYDSEFVVLKVRGGRLISKQYLGD